MSRPFFTIVIPTFNRCEFIPVAINSILAQSCQDFEIVVVDDGSEDNTSTIVNNINDSRIRYFKKENEERSIARNFGINLANGKYVNFLDSDDIFYAEHLGSAFDLITQKEFPEIAHLGYEFVENGKVVLKRNSLNASYLETMIHENILHANAMFIRRDIAAIYQFPNSKFAFMSEDWYLWLRLISRYNLCYENKITSAVIDHGNRSLKSINLIKLAECTHIIVAGLKDDEVFCQKFSRNKSVFFSNQYSFAALIFSLNRKQATSLKFMLKAFLEDPAVVFRRRFLAALKYTVFPQLIRQNY